MTLGELKKIVNQFDEEYDDIPVWVNWHEADGYGKGTPRVRLRGVQTYCDPPIMLSIVGSEEGAEKEKWDDFPVEELIEVYDTYHHLHPERYQDEDDD